MFCRDKSAPQLRGRLSSVNQRLFVPDCVRKAIDGISVQNLCARHGVLLLPMVPKDVGGTSRGHESSTRFEITSFLSIWP
jgi:hypothetical protein